MPSATPPVFLSSACWCSEEAAFQDHPADSAARTADPVAAAAAAVGIVVGQVAAGIPSPVVADTADSVAADTADSTGPDSPAVGPACPAYPACYYQRPD